MEEASSDLDVEEMALISRKFKKFFKKAKENSKKKNFSKFKNNDREQFLGCFKCGKLEDIVKNCPLLKEEQEAEQSKKQGRKQAGNSSARFFSKAMLVAWEDSIEEDEGTEEEDAAVALMAKSDTDSDDEPLDSLAYLKDEVRGLKKAKLEELLFTLMDECDAINSKNSMLKDACSELKRDIRELEHENKILKSEKIETDMTNLVLHEVLKKVKETLRLKEEAFATDLTKLKNESLVLKQKVESLLVENKKLLEKLKQVESDLAANRRWNNASQVLNWLNTHHNRGRKGLDFVTKRTVYPVNRKYVGLPENIMCFHCGKMRHYRYVCPLRRYAMDKNLFM